MAYYDAIFFDTTREDYGSRLKSVLGGLIQVRLYQRDRM